MKKIDYSDLKIDEKESYLSNCSCNNRSTHPPIFGRIDERKRIFKNEEMKKIDKIK